MPYLRKKYISTWFNFVNKISYWKVKICEFSNIPNSICNYLLKIWILQLGVLMWQKRRRAELRRWTFGQHTTVYASRHPDVVMDDVRHPGGVMVDGVDLSTPSFDDQLRLSFDRDAVYRPTTISSSNGTMTSSSHDRIGTGADGDGASSLMTSSASIRSTLSGASSAVARLVRRLTTTSAQFLAGRQGDILHVPLTEHMEDERVTFWWWWRWPDGWGVVALLVSCFCKLMHGNFY